MDYIVCDENKTAYEVAGLFDIRINPDKKLGEISNYRWIGDLSTAIRNSIVDFKDLGKINKLIRDDSSEFIAYSLSEAYYDLKVRPMSYAEFDLEEYEVIRKVFDDLKYEEEDEPVQEDQWDEKIRGKKMSSSSGNVIFKYQMPVKEHFEMKLPRGAKIIRVADQDGFFWLWAVVNTNVPDEVRKFHAVKCGANMPDVDPSLLVYHGFCAIFVQQELGLYIFEEISQ